MAQDFPDVILGDQLVDLKNAYRDYQLSRFDVNDKTLFGDILSDESSTLPGTLGGHAIIGPESGPSMYEGSAPDSCGIGAAVIQSLMILSVAR